jgi:HK97 family phage prohead protease
MSENGKAKPEFRALPHGYELRSEDEGMPTLTGSLAVLNEWTEIDSRSEGHFMEQLAPGSFDKTISENRDKMRVLFQHGSDPQIGDKPLGSIESLQASERSIDYEVPLLDTTYNRDLLPGLEAGLYGSSFRFEVLRQNWDRKAERSDHNPQGLPERTVKEVRMVEFGPVTFPAYAGATAGIRSVTDRMLAERIDTEDLDCLAQMIVLAAGYIEEQDEPGDQANVPRMEAVIQTLHELQAYEISEDEPPEDEEASAKQRATEALIDAGFEPVRTPPRDRAGTSHPIRGRRAEVAVPLYTGTKEVEPRWRLK